MAATPTAPFPHPINSLIGQSDSPDNPVKQLVATNNKDAIVTMSLKVLTSLVNQVHDMTTKTWADADDNFAIAWRTDAMLEKRILGRANAFARLASKERPPVLSPGP